jgi:hypothetical protein
MKHFLGTMCCSLVFWLFAGWLGYKIYRLKKGFW